MSRQCSVFLYPLLIVTLFLITIKESLRSKFFFTSLSYVQLDPYCTSPIFIHFLVACLPPTSFHSLRLSSSAKESSSRPPTHVPVCVVIPRVHAMRKNEREGRIPLIEPLLKSRKVPSFSRWCYRALKDGRD
jgi:hypothetical protein